MKWLSAVAVCVLTASAPVRAQAPNLEKLDLVLKAVPDGPVAMVNGKTVPAADFADLYKSELTRLELMNRGKPITDRVRLDLGIRCLGMIIENEILHREAVKRKISVSDEDVEKGWQSQLKLMQNQFKAAQDRSPTGGDKTLSEADLLKTAGVSREDALREIKEVMLLQKMRSEIAKEKGVAVTDKEVSDFFHANKSKVGSTESCHLKLIFVRADQGRAAGGVIREKAKEKADEALKRIRAGQSFEAVAKAVSDGMEKAKGGDLGPRPVKAFPPYIIEAASKLQPDEISGVLEGDKGFYIVKLVENIAGVEPNLEKAAPQIKQMLLASKVEQSAKDFCRKYLEDPDAVKIFMDLNKAIELHPGLGVKGES